MLFEDKQQQLNTPLAWSCDGTTLYHAYDQIHATDPETCAANPVTSFREAFSVNSHLHCSPDNQRLVFYRDTLLSLLSSGGLSGQVSIPEHSGDTIPQLRQDDPRPSRPRR